MGATHRGPRGGRVTRPGRITRAVDWLLRNRKTGALTIVQVPNAPLVVFLVAAAVRRFVNPEGNAGAVVSVVAMGALLWWALDELIRGVNPFRKMLGAVVLVLTSAGILIR